MKTYFPLYLFFLSCLIFTFSRFIFWVLNNFQMISRRNLKSLPMRGVHQSWSRMPATPTKLTILYKVGTNRIWSFTWPVPGKSDKNWNYYSNWLPMCLFSCLKKISGVHRVRQRWKILLFRVGHQLSNRLHIRNCIVSKYWTLLIDYFWLSPHLAATAPQFWNPKDMSIWPENKFSLLLSIRNFGTLYDFKTPLLMTFNKKFRM